MAVSLKKILVLCTGNSCRSQIAEGYLRYYAKGNAQVYSAGVETHGVNPSAIQIMKEDGVDISNHTSNHIDEYSTIDFDFVTMQKRDVPFFRVKLKNFITIFRIRLKQKVQKKTLCWNLGGLEK